jgi:hypothetical protein
MILTAPRTFTWERPADMGRPEKRGGFTDTPNDAGVRRWAEQLINAYRYGRDPNVLHEIWIDGNWQEQQVAQRLMAEYGDER